MNKNKIFGLILSTIILSTGCSDNFLKEKTDHNSFDPSIFESEVQTGRFIDKVYYDFFAAYKSPVKTLVGEYKDDRSAMTEELGGTISNFTNPGKQLENASDCPAYYGSVLGTNPKNEPYNRIRNCNIVLENIDVIGKDLPEAFRNKAKGQMYFLRALQYFDLVRVYGGVPIVTKVLTASADDESIKYPRAKTSECFEQIVKDLDIAAELLPARWEKEGEDYGRFTRAAALAMKSRVLLTAASPLFNKDWDNTNSELWNKALEAGLTAERELTSAGYGLYGKSAKDWSAMFYSFDNKFCPEVIMVQLCSPAVTASTMNNEWENGVRLASQKGAGGKPAPREMIDLFPMADGTRPTGGNGYNSELFFLNRDPRFYRTFAFSGMKWGHKTNKDAVVWTYRYKKANGSTIVYAGNDQLKSPAYVRKMSDPNADQDALKYSGTDIYEYRYAELLLNIAECYAAKGDIGNAVTYLSKIRARVGLSSANNYGIGNIADKYAALEACLYERRVELAYEGKRFWDIQRWMLYNDDISSGNNTCAKLRIKEINGTCRTGSHWEAIVNSDSDPIAPLTSSISIDPDASNFKEELNALAKLYKENLKTVQPELAMDVDNKKPVNILWRQNYYIFGINNQVLSNNTWLVQTKGWNDIGGTLGTFDYQE